MKNLTMMVVLFFSIILSFKTKLFRCSNNVIIISFLIFFYFVNDFSNNYYLDRLNLSRDSNNFSTLVLMQGWENTFLNFFNSYGLGLGSQQLGFNGYEREISSKILYMLKNEHGLNRRDGGSTAPKIISEFGFFGIVFLIIYLRLFIKSFNYIRKYCLGKFKGNNNVDIILFCHVAVVSLSIDLFIRGLAYFSSTYFIFLLLYIIFH